jgi:hypothetical protein
VRLVLAGVWLGAGVAQLAAIQPPHTLSTVDSIQHVLGPLLPWFELALGALLLLGVGIRPTAALATALEVLLAAGATGAPLPTQPLDYPCLWDRTCLTIASGTAQAATESLFGGLGLVLLCLWLVARPRCALAMDNVLTTGPYRRTRPAHAAGTARVRRGNGTAQSVPTSRYESRR